MIKTFKTKQQVEVNARTRATAKVFVDISDVIFNGLAYYGRASYYYNDENGERTHIENVTATFTVEEAALLEAQGPLDGETLTEKYVSLIIRATLYQFETEQYYNIGASGWETYVPPVPEVQPEPEIEPENTENTNTTPAFPEEDVPIETENQDPGV